MNTSNTPLPSPTSQELFHRYWRKKIAPRWEHWYPSILGCIAVAITFFFCNCQPSEYARLVESVIPNAVSVASILAGFQGALYAILLSLLQSRVVKILKKQKHYATIIGYINIAIFSLAFFIVFGLILMTANAFNPTFSTTTQPSVIFPAIPSVSGPRIACAILVGSFVHALASSYRILRLLIMMLDADGNTE